MTIHLFSPTPLDTIVKEHLFDDWDQYSGMNIFVEEWVDQTTYATAADLITTFGLQGELGFDNEPLTPEIVEERYAEVSTVFQDIRAALDENSVRQLNEDSEVAVVGGPEYVTGQDGLRFGLTFEASWDDLQDLREEFPRTKEEEEEEVREASVHTAAHDELRCTRRAIEALKRVDFGFHGGRDQADNAPLFRYSPMPGLDMLHQAQDSLGDCGLYNEQIALAIRAYRTRRDRAEALIHGPSGMGSNHGALNDLIESIAHAKDTGRQKMTERPKYVRYAGVLYQRVGDEQEVREAYTLPKKMKGVKPCGPKDQTDEKSKSEQVWCVFDWKGNLRGRFKGRKKALQHKVFMINRGKGVKGGGK